MKKMNKVLGLLAFAGVVTGVSLNGAAKQFPDDVSAHSLYVEVDGMIKTGFSFKDLKDSRQARINLISLFNDVWAKIETYRAAGKSFGQYFTTQEVSCVVIGLTSVVSAIEQEVGVIWGSKFSNEFRQGYKDAFTSALDEIRLVTVEKINKAQRLGAMYPSDIRLMLQVFNQSMDKLKERVVKVFTVEPDDASVLNAQPVRGEALQQGGSALPVTTRDVEGMGAVFRKHVASVGAGLICLFIGTAAAAQAAGLI